MTNDDQNQNRDNTVRIVGPALRDLTPLAFAVFGNGQLAYIKPVNVDGEDAFAVHSADGQQLAVVAAREVAFTLVRQNDLDPVSVH
jgi:hypothetical protein